MEYRSFLHTYSITFVHQNTQLDVFYFFPCTLTFTFTLSALMAKRVAVIGAGAAGLCAVRHLSASPEIFSVVCYELGPTVGGTWNYTDRTGKDENGLPIQSSMYKNLRSVA